MAKNLFCDRSDLRNEADVEQNFARRLLERLGYSDREILPKQSLDYLTVGGMRGHPRSRYKPDFGIRLKRKVRWIVEAKAPDQRLDEHEWQPRAYCVLMNGTTSQDRPVKYHLLTNGGETRLYDPYLNLPLLQISFSDFHAGNQKYQRLTNVLSKDYILKSLQPATGPMFRLQKCPLFRRKCRIWLVPPVYLPKGRYQSIRCFFRIREAYSA